MHYLLQLTQTAAWTVQMAPSDRIACITLAPSETFAAHLVWRQLLEDAKASDTNAATAPGRIADRGLSCAVFFLLTKTQGCPVGECVATSAILQRNAIFLCRRGDDLEIHGPTSAFSVFPKQAHGAHYVQT